MVENTIVLLLSTSEGLMYGVLLGIVVIPLHFMSWEFLHLRFWFCRVFDGDKDNKYRKWDLDIILEVEFDSKYAI